MPPCAPVFTFHKKAQQIYCSLSYFRITMFIIVITTKKLSPFVQYINTFKFHFTSSKNIILFGLKLQNKCDK